METPAASTGLWSQAPPAVDPQLPSAATANLPEDGEISDSDSDSDDDGLRPFKQILARATPLIDLTGDDDDDRVDDGDDDSAEVSWLENLDRLDITQR